MICKIIAWLFLLSSIPCVYLIIQTHFSTKSAYKAHGTVVAIDRSSLGGRTGNTKYLLRVTYRDRNGIMQQIGSSQSSRFPDKNIGDTVIILNYSDGSKPKVLLFDDLFTCYLIWLGAIIYGCGFIIGNDFLEWFYG